jgi:cell division protein FtsZ
MFKLTRSTGAPVPHRVCVVGVGGGGCRAINCVDSGASGPAIVALNTDSRSLEESRAATKVQIGVEDGEGFGAGGDPDLGKLAAEHDVEMIRGLFTDADVAVIVTCLGGGTGTGATPVVLETAHAAGVFTIVLATLPFGFEGEKRKALADQGLRAAISAADVVCAIPNDRLFEAVDAKEVKVAFKKADEMLAGGICSLWQMLVQPAFVGIDLADLSALASRSGGACWFGFGDASGVGRAQAAVSALLDGPVLEKGRALRTGGAALICVSGSHDLALTEVGDVMAALSKEVPDDCDLTMGAVINEKWRDRILVSAFVADRKRVASSKSRAVSPSPPLKGGRKRKNRDLQDKLKLDVSGKGRFKNVEATIMDGEDLDIPTFVRRGIQIERQS